MFWSPGKEMGPRGLLLRPAPSWPLSIRAFLFPVLAPLEVYKPAGLRELAQVPLAHGDCSLMGCDLIKCSFFSSDFLTILETFISTHDQDFLNHGLHRLNDHSPVFSGRALGQLSACSMAERLWDTHSYTVAVLPGSKRPGEERGPSPRLSRSRYSFNKGSLSEYLMAELCESHEFRPQRSWRKVWSVGGWLERVEETLDVSVFIILGDLCDLDQGQVVVNSFNKHLF